MNINNIDTTIHRTENHKNISSKLFLIQRAVPDNSSLLIKYMLLLHANLRKNMINQKLNSEILFISSFNNEGINNLIDYLFKYNEITND